jgi:hypothetical protein
VTGRRCRPVAIPGSGELRLAELVCDDNGTLARDGRLLAGVDLLRTPARLVATLRD